MAYFPTRDNLVNQNLMDLKGTTDSLQAQITVISTSVFNYLVWGDSTADATLVKDTGYIANNIARLNYALPATAAVGDRFGICGKGAGGWKVTQAAGQRIWLGPVCSITGATGYLRSDDYSDVVHIICITADTDFKVVWSCGNLVLNV